MKRSLGIPIMLGKFQEQQWRAVLENGLCRDIVLVQRRMFNYQLLNTAFIKLFK